MSSALSVIRLSSSDSAGITRLSSKFVFSGDRVHVTNVETNGSAMALSADGFYWWRTGGLDFRGSPRR